MIVHSYHQMVERQKTASLLEAHEMECWAVLLCVTLITGILSAYGQRCNDQYMPDELKPLGCTTSPNSIQSLLKSCAFRSPFLEKKQSVYLKTAIVCDGGQVFGIICRSCKGSSGEIYHAEANLYNYLSSVLQPGDVDQIRGQVRGGRQCEMWTVINKEPCEECGNLHLRAVQTWMKTRISQMASRIAWAGFYPQIKYRCLKNCLEMEGMGNTVQKGYRSYQLLREVGFTTYLCRFTDEWFSRWQYKAKIKEWRQQQTRCEVNSMTQQGRFPGPVYISYKDDCLHVFGEEGVPIISPKW